METSHVISAQGRTASLLNLPASLSFTASHAPLRIERLETTDAILTAIHDLDTAGSTGFQSASWLGAVYRHLVPATGTPLAIAFACSRTGDRMGLLPLYVYRHKNLRVAKFADCGVSDYNALLTRDAGSAQRIADAGLLDLVKPSLRGIDILALERIAASPLARARAANPSRMQGNALTIIDTVDDFLRSRGKKYRKEAERAFRVLDSHGTWSFQRASTPEDIATAFAELERQQAGRHAEKAGQYALSAPRFSAFYRELLLDAPGSTHIFTLTVDGVIIAALLGITNGNTFTLLRIANGGEAWRQVSPGRLIVIEAMRYFCARGVKTFDMGIGDYAFKRGFGTQPVPLADIIVALSWRGIPTVAAYRLKERLRQNEALRSAVRTLKARLGALRA